MISKAVTKVILSALSLLMASQYTFALEFHLDMDATPSSKGFTLNGSQPQQDITTVPGKLTLDVGSGETAYFNRNVTWGDSDKMIRFGATLNIEKTSGGWTDRYFSFTCNINGVVHYVGLSIGINGTTTQIQFGDITQDVSTPAKNGSHTYHVDIDKTTKIATFYFDGIQVGDNGLIVASLGSGYTFISFGDSDGGSTGHKETWDDVFFDNEVPSESSREPTVLSLVGSDEGLKQDLVLQMGGDAPLDPSIQLNKNAKWVSTPGFGMGLEFPGDGSWALIPDFPTQDIGNEVTISCFFKCDDVMPKDTNKVCGAIFSYDYDWLGRVYETGEVYGGMRNENGELKGVSSSVKIEPRRWYHLALVWSSQTNQFTSYLNGVRIGVRSDTLSSLKVLSGHNFVLGLDPDGSSFNGIIADFKIYKRALDKRVVKQIASKVEMPFTAKPNYPQLYAFITEAISEIPLLPDSKIDAKFLGETIAFTAAPGEYEPTSFVLRSTIDFNEVTFSISDLQGADGLLPASVLDLKLVKCWYQGPAAWRNEDPGKYPNVMVPELLLNDHDLVRVDETTEKNFVRYGTGTEAYYFDVSDRTDNNNFWHVNLTIAENPIYDAPTLQPLPLTANRNQQFFITLHAPENTKAGNYTGVISVESEGEELAQLAVTVNILPFTLAEARTYYNLEKPYMTSLYNNAYLREEGQGGITGYFRDRHQIREELKNLLAHGVKYPTNFQLNAGDISEPENEALFREMLQLRKEVGMPNRPLYLISNPKINLPQSLPATPEGLQQLTDRATMVMNWVEEELGHRDVYFYGVDEAKGNVLQEQIPFFNAIQAAGGKTFCSGYSEEILPPGNFAVVGNDLDLLICAAKPTRKEAAKWHSVGHDVWCYAYPQAGNENPEIFRRGFGLLTYKANYDGSATFCYYMAFGHPWNDFDSTLQRDLNLVYPTADGVVDTLAFEGYREAYDDIRYATTMKLECEEAKLSGDSARIAAAEEAEEFLETRNVILENLAETRSLIIKHILKLRQLGGKNKL